MTIEEYTKQVVALRTEMEQRILAAISDFEKETGLKVDRISLFDSPTLSHGRRAAYTKGVQAEARL